MCTVCQNKDMPCAKVLQFKYMPVMKRYKSDDIEDNINYIIVKCLMFIKLDKQA